MVSMGVRRKTSLSGLSWISMLDTVSPSQVGEVGMEFQLERKVELQNSDGISSFRAT